MFENDSPFNQFLRNQLKLSIFNEFSNKRLKTQFYIALNQFINFKLKLMAALQFRLTKV